MDADETIVRIGETNTEGIQKYKAENEELVNFLTARPGLEKLVFRYRDPNKWGKKWGVFRDVMLNNPENEWLPIQRILKLIGLAVLPKKMKDMLESRNYFFSKSFIEVFKKFLPQCAKFTFAERYYSVVDKRKGRNHFNRALLPELRVSFDQVYKLFSKQGKPILEAIL